MKLNELSPEWVAFTYKTMGKYQKEQGEQEYYMYYDVDIPKIAAEVTQHYQSRVVELIEAKLKHFTSEKDKEQKISTEYKNIQYIVYCSCMIQEYKQLLTDLTNLKP